MSVKRCVLLLAAMLLALTACHGGTPTPKGQPSRGVDRDKLFEAAKCMRSHGFPDFPDPIQAEGTWVIPAPANDLPAPAACADLFRGAKGPGPQRELSPSQIADRRKWADCIRAHGISNLPDPDSNGQFNLPPELDPITAQPKWNEASEACRSLQPADMHPEDN
jgi:hypothetical protein